MLISGVLFLALMFTLDDKIIFLILWVATVLYTVALMIRAEYKFQQFKYYLGLSDKPFEDDDEIFESDTDESEETRQ